MNPAELEVFLTQSLADQKLSGSEKQSFAAWLVQNVKTDQQRGVARHVAFEVARKSVTDPDAAKVIEWLEDVLKVIVPMRANPGADAPGSPGSAPESVCFAPGEGCLRHIVSRFHTARKTADVCVFTITDDRITRAIMDAHKRGVKLRIISDNDKANDAGSDLRSFEAAGIPVKYDDVRGPAASGLTGHMHHKFAIFDGTRLINGSYNWTRGAAEMNYENLTDTDDPTLVAAFAAEFERLWKKF
jgi:phosphatidylserine/phosphatidylglycerophosphate/cardiolipin synthase-like enzyme